MDLSQESILSFLLERDGSVRNSELVNKFKALLNSSDPAEKKANRDAFKRLVNNIAVVKQIDDVKFVVVKKKYQRFVKGGTKSLENSLFALKPACVSRSGGIQTADIINNNNYYYCSAQTGSHGSRCSSLESGPSEKAGGPSDRNVSLTARVLSVTSDARGGQTGSVFALVAIKSPPKRDLQHDETGNLHHKAPGEDSVQQKQLEIRTPQVTAEKTTKLKETAYKKNSFLYSSTRTKRKELEAQGSPQLRRWNKVTRPGNEAKDAEVFPLGLVEHEWLVKSAEGCWSHIYSLLIQDPHLAEKRNFMSGFTVLHWAAKSGNSDTVCKVIDVSRQSNEGINVNVKSYDGYTPLHIAAIHSHERVLSLLVCEYGADTNIRDNSGKKPYRYLSQDVSSGIRKMLGDPQVLQTNAQCHLEVDHSVSKGFNTLSKLFQPHITGHKKKSRHRPSFHFISDGH